MLPNLSLACSLAPRCQCLVYGLTNSPDHCLLEPECIFYSLVYIFIANSVEIDQLVFSPTLSTDISIDGYFANKSIFGLKGT